MAAILATLWVPDLWPFGCSAVAAIVICAHLLLAASPRTNPSVIFQTLVIFAAPVVLLTLRFLLLVASRRPGPDASEFVAGYVLTACGLPIAAEFLRHAGLARFLGMFWWHLFGSLLLAEIWLTLLVGRYVSSVSPAAGGIMFLAQLPIWTVTACMVAPRRRWKEGTCATCGYCLAGNVSGRCPECGVKVDKETASTSSVL